MNTPHPSVCYRFRRSHSLYYPSFDLAFPRQTSWEFHLDLNHLPGFPWPSAPPFPMCPGSITSPVSPADGPRLPFPCLISQLLGFPPTPRLLHFSISFALCWPFLPLIIVRIPRAIPQSLAALHLSPLERLNAVTWHLSAAALPRSQRPPRSTLRPHQGFERMNNVTPRVPGPSWVPRRLPLQQKRTCRCPRRGTRPSAGSSVAKTVALEAPRATTVDSRSEGLVGATAWRIPPAGPSRGGAPGPWRALSPTFSLPYLITLAAPGLTPSALNIP